MVTGIFSAWASVGGPRPDGGPAPVYECAMSIGWCALPQLDRKRDGALHALTFGELTLRCNYFCTVLLAVCGSRVPRPP